MYELISNPGLRFELFDLRGTLTYTFARDGKPAKQYVLSETDFEGVSYDEGSDSERSQAPKSRTDASAVGIQLRLLKNEGLLHMDFEGKEGGSASWSFKGLDFGAGKPMFASASTQTHVEPDKCVICGHEVVTPKMVQDDGTQTRTPTGKDTGTQTNVIYTAEVSFTAKAGVKSRIQQKLLTDNAAQGRALKAEAENTGASTTQSISAQTDTSIDPGTSDSAYIRSVTTGISGQELKRKASLQPRTGTPVNKRAKSKHDSTPWPRRIYMECWRERPIRGEDGCSQTLKVPGLDSSRRSLTRQK